MKHCQGLLSADAYDVAGPIELRSGEAWFRVPNQCPKFGTAVAQHRAGKIDSRSFRGGRMEAFNDAIEKFLWPEKRLNKDPSGGLETNARCICAKNLYRNTLRGLAGPDRYKKIGPIPKGTPVKLLANLEPDLQHSAAFVKAAEQLIKINGENISPEAAPAELRKLVPTS